MDPSQAIMVVSHQTGEIVLKLAKGIYPLDAVYGAAYVFIDRAYLLLGEDDSAVEVQFRAKGSAELPALEAVVGEFGNELLSQTLRRRITRENQPILEAIVAQALAGAAGSPAPAALDEGGDDDLDFLDDPLGIAVPWEERFKKSGSPAAEKGPSTEAGAEAAPERVAGPGQSGGLKPTGGQ